MDYLFYWSCPSLLRLIISEYQVYGDVDGFPKLVCLVSELILVARHETSYQEMYK